MAPLSRRYKLAAILFPFLLVAMSGLARANNIFVNTTSGKTQVATACSLPDAIIAHNIGGSAPISGCGAGKQ